uniref:Uncharacterized protein n=1 Tax=Arundo donax TaxID=35708 RepID=A0A0A8ZMI6_ARUDO
MHLRQAHTQLEFNTGGWRTRHSWRIPQLALTES